MRWAAYRNSRDELLQLRRDLSPHSDPFELRGLNHRLVNVYLGEAPASEAYSVLQMPDRSLHANCRRILSGLQTRCEVACFAGDVDYALQTLTTADQLGLIDLLWLDRCPLLDPIRDDSEFATVRESVNVRCQLLCETLRIEA